MTATIRRAAAAAKLSEPGRRQAAIAAAVMLIGVAVSRRALTAG